MGNLSTQKLKQFQIVIVYLGKGHHHNGKSVMQMLFFWLFLIGLVLPLFMIKIKSRWAAWIPAIIFGVLTIIMGVSTKFITAESMKDLGQIIFFMVFGATTLGSLIGGIIVHFIKNR